MTVRACEMHPLASPDNILTTSTGLKGGAVTDPLNRMGLPSSSPSFLPSTRSIGVRLEGIWRTIGLPAGQGPETFPTIPTAPSLDDVRLFIGDEA